MGEQEEGKNQEIAFQKSAQEQVFLADSFLLHQGFFFNLFIYFVDLLLFVPWRAPLILR